jgi:hypothetical protein
VVGPLRHLVAIIVVLVFVASCSATAQPPTASPASSATASPASGLVTHENALLGYRINLPDKYRLALAVVDGPNNVGHDFYVPRTEQAERDLCVREKGGDIGSPERVEDLRVAVHSNAAGISPVEFVSAPTRRIVFTSIEPTTVDGHEAVRIVQQPTGDTAYYVIRANDRLYELAPFIYSQPSLGNAGGTFAAPKGWLDQIAASFEAIPLQASPTTPTSRTTLCGN